MTLGCFFEPEDYISLLILLKMSLFILLLFPWILFCMTSWRRTGNFCLVLPCLYWNSYSDSFNHTEMEMSGPWVRGKVEGFTLSCVNHPCRAKHYLDTNLVDFSPCWRQDVSVVSTILAPGLVWLPWWWSVGLCLHAQPSLHGCHQVSVP